METGLPEKLLVTVEEAATLLSISERKLWSLTVGGEIPHTKIGRRTLYSPAVLREWIAEQTISRQD